MFGKKFKSRKQTDAESVIEKQAPPTARTPAVDEFGGVLATLAVANGRAFVLGAAVVLVLLVAVSSIRAMIPLRGLDIWVVEVNAETGERTLYKDAARRVEDYVPGQKYLEREFMTFVRGFMTLNADAIGVWEDGIASSYRTYARDKAPAEIQEWIDKDRSFERMRTIKGLVRTVEKRTITYRADSKVALLRFSTSERSAGQTTPLIRHYAMTINYVLKPPSKDRDAQRDSQRDEVEANPLGLYVTHFDLQEESQ